MSAGTDSYVQTLLVSPCCRDSLDWSADRTRCSACGRAFELADGIPVLLADTRSPETDEHRRAQAAYFDHVEPEFEITRPVGAPALYRWLMDEKFRRSVTALEPILRGATAASICAGSGMDAYYLARAGARVIAFDVSLEAARRARERARRFGLAITPVVADAARLPLADQSIDLAYVHDGLHHLEEPFAGLNEIARVARRAVSVNEPARAAATALAVRAGAALTYEEAGNRVVRLRAADVSGALRAQGFEVLVAERYGMYYRHEPGRVFRLLSQEPLLSFVTRGISAFNSVAGAIGNKLTVQAVRT